jgi:hypothetical protein
VRGAAKPRLSDPGGEVSNAAIGSLQWAQRWRLEVQATCHTIPSASERLARYWALGNAHDIWRLLDRSDGTPFESVEEFCRAKEPCGLGTLPALLGLQLDAMSPGRRVLTMTPPASVLRQLIKDLARDYADFQTFDAHTIDLPAQLHALAELKGYLDDLPPETLELCWELLSKSRDGLDRFMMWRGRTQSAS